MNVASIQHLRLDQAHNYMIDPITLAQITGLCVLSLQVIVAVVGIRKSDSGAEKFVAISSPTVAFVLFAVVGISTLSESRERIGKGTQSLYLKVESSRSASTSEAQKRAITRTLEHQELAQRNLDKEFLSELRRYRKNGIDLIQSSSVPELEAPIGATEGYPTLFQSVRNSVAASATRTQSLISPRNFAFDQSLYQDRREESNAQGRLDALELLAIDIGWVGAKNGLEYERFLPMWQITRPYVIEGARERSAGQINANLASMRKLAEELPRIATDPSREFDGSRWVLYVALVAFASLPSAVLLFFKSISSRLRWKLSLLATITLTCGILYANQDLRIRGCVSALDKIEKDLSTLNELTDDAFAQVDSQADTASSLKSRYESEVMTINVDPVDTDAAVASLRLAHEDLETPALQLLEAQAKLVSNLSGNDALFFPQMIGQGVLGESEYWISRYATGIKDTLAIDGLLEAEVAKGADANEQADRAKFRRRFLSLRLRTSLENLTVSETVIIGDTKAAIGKCASAWAHAAIEEYGLGSVLLKP